MNWTKLSSSESRCLARLCHAGIIKANPSDLEKISLTIPLRAGIRNARAKGKRSPAADPALISELKALVASGKSLREVGTMLSISVATAHKYRSIAATNL